MKEHFDKLEADLAQNDGYRDQNEYWSIDTQILDASVNGDVDAVLRLISDHNVKRLPSRTGSNGNFPFSELNSNSYHNWTALGHLLNSQAPQEKLLEFLNEISRLGLRPNQAFPHGYGFNEEDLDINMAEDGLAQQLTGPVLIAIGRS